MQTLVPLLKQTLQTYAEKPSEFHRELQLYFGFGALTLERMIVKELFQKLNLGTCWRNPFWGPTISRPKSIESSSELMKSGSSGD